MIAVELQKPANRIVERRWPQAKTVPDVRLVDAAMIKQWHLEFPMAEEIHKFGPASHVWTYLGYVRTDKSRSRFIASFWPPPH